MRARLNLPQRIGYASGNLGKNLQWKTVDFLYLYFLTDFLMLDPWLAGFAIFASLVWDGIAGPLIGYLIDRYRDMLGSYQRMILISAPICAALFCLIFIMPLLLPGSAFIWALIASLLFRTGFALVDIPHNALLAEVTRDPTERGTLTVYRSFFSAMAGIAVSIAGVAFFKSQHETNLGGIFGFVALVGLIYLVVMISTALATPKSPISASRIIGRTSLIDASRQLIFNRVLVVLLAVCAISALLIPVYFNLTVYFAKSWLGNPKSSTQLLLWYTAGQITSIFILNLAVKHLSKCVIAIVANALFATSIFFFALAPISLVTAAICFALVGFAYTGINTMNWALIPDSIDRTELLTGERHEALTIGVFLLIFKVFAGASLALTGIALTVIGYSSESTGLAEPPESLIHIMTVVPMLGALINMLLLRNLRRRWK